MFEPFSSCTGCASRAWNSIVRCFRGEYQKSFRSAHDLHFCCLLLQIYVPWNETQLTLEQRVIDDSAAFDMPQFGVRFSAFAELRASQTSPALDVNG